MARAANARFDLLRAVARLALAHLGSLKMASKLLHPPSDESERVVTLHALAAIEASLLALLCAVAW